MGSVLESGNSLSIMRGACQCATVYQCACACMVCHCLSMRVFHCLSMHLSQSVSISQCACNNVNDHTPSWVKACFWFICSLAVVSFLALASRVAILIDQCVARAILGPSATSTLLPDACNRMQLAIHSVHLLVEHAADTLEALAGFLSSCDTSLASACDLDALDFIALLTSFVAALETFERLLSSAVSQMEAFDRVFDGSVALQLGQKALRLAVDTFATCARYFLCHLHDLFQLAVGALFQLAFLSLVIVLIVAGTHIELALPVFTLVMGLIAVAPSYRVVYLDDGRHDASFHTRQIAYLRAKQEYISYVARARRTAKRRQRRRQWRFWHATGGGVATFSSEWKEDLAAWQQARLSGDNIGMRHVKEVHTRITRPFPRLNRMESWKRHRPPSPLSFASMQSAATPTTDTTANAVAHANVTAKTTATLSSPPFSPPPTEWQRHEDSWHRDEAIHRSRCESSGSSDSIPDIPEPTTSELIDHFICAELDATGVDLVAAQLAHERAHEVDSATDDATGHQASQTEKTLISSASHCACCPPGFQPRLRVRGLDGRTVGNGGSERKPSSQPFLQPPLLSPHGGPQAQRSSKETVSMQVFVMDQFGEPFPGLQGPLDVHPSASIAHVKARATQTLRQGRRRPCPTFTSGRRLQTRSSRSSRSCRGAMEPAAHPRPLPTWM